MKRCVVAEHQRCQVDLPVERGVVNERVQVFLDGLVGDFGLAVALRVVGCGFQMASAQLIVQ